MPLDWPPEFGRMFVSCLAAAVVARLFLSLCRFLFALARPELRVSPVNGRSARFATRRATGFVTWIALGVITIELVHGLDVRTPTVIAMHRVQRPVADPCRPGRWRSP